MEPETNGRTGVSTTVLVKMDRQDSIDALIGMWMIIF